MDTPRNFTESEEFLTLMRTIEIVLLLAVIRILLSVFIEIFVNQSVAHYFELIYIGFVLLGLIGSAPFIYQKKWVKITVASFWTIVAVGAIYFRFFYLPALKIKKIIQKTLKLGGLWINKWN